jgi:hypothetical protein
MTLIEVLASLVMLATLLAGLLTAYGAHQRQLRRAEQRLAAIQAADELLAGWYGPRERVPRNANGLLPGTPPWRWRTRAVQRSFVEVLPVEVVRLELFPAMASMAETEPAAQVDLLLPGSDTGSMMKGLVPR